MKKTILIILFVCLHFYTTPTSAEYFEVTTSSPVLMHIAGSLNIEGEPARPGDEIGVFDESGKIVGCFVVKKNGIYGDMTISGDYNITGIKEGSLENEKLEIKVWQATTNTEYIDSQIQLKLPEEGKVIYTPYPEQSLRFKGGNFYLINIEVD